jgi:hypothetical protein
MKFKSYVSPKPNVQKMLSALRKAGITVTKENGGYVGEAIGVMGERREIFRAMNGGNGYLVRHVADLFA